MSNEEKVREAAYFIWLNNGCPEGVEIDCWLEAEAQEGGECCCACEDKPAKKAPAKKAAAKKAEDKPAKKAPAKKATAKK